MTYDGKDCHVHRKTGVADLEVTEHHLRVVVEDLCPLPNVIHNVVLGNGIMDLQETHT